MTFEQAVSTVRAGGSIMASNQATAKLVADQFKYKKLESPHGGAGYYWHYHITKTHDNIHIWFYGDPYLLD